MKYKIMKIILFIIAIMVIYSLTRPKINYKVDFVKMKIAEQDIFTKTNKILANELNDAWGNKYVYIKPGKYNKKDIDIYSRGKNGIGDGTDFDDINNWDKNKKWRRYY